MAKLTFTDPFGLCPQNLEKEPCTPGTVIWHKGPGSNASLDTFAQDAAKWLNTAIVVNSADRTFNPTGSNSYSEHRTDLGGRGALDVHLYNADGSQVPDSLAAKSLAGVRDETSAGVRVIWHTQNTATTGEHVHLDTRTDKGDRKESRPNQYDRINFN